MRDDAVVEAVADAQDLLLALAQRAQQPVELLVLELQLDQALDRDRRLAQVLGRELLERARGLEPSSSERSPEISAASRSARGVEMPSSAAISSIRGSRPESRAQRALGAHEAVHLLEHLHRDAHRRATARRCPRRIAWRIQIAA